MCVKWSRRSIGQNPAVFRPPRRPLQALMLPAYLPALLPAAGWNTHQLLEVLVCYCFNSHESMVSCIPDYVLWMDVNVMAFIVKIHDFLSHFRRLSPPPEHKQTWMHPVNDTEAFWEDEFKSSSLPPPVLPRNSAHKRDASLPSPAVCRQVRGPPWRLWPGP